MRDNYRIAEINIEIVSLYDRVHALCRDYQTDGAPELAVTVTEADIARERETADGPYPDDYLETLAVYRQIAEAMPRWDTVKSSPSATHSTGVDRKRNR